MTHLSFAFVLFAAGLSPEDGSPSPEVAAKIAFARDLRQRSPEAAKAFLRKELDSATEKSGLWLELARTELAIAHREPPRNRPTHYQAARTALEQVDRRLPFAPVVLEARAERARIDVLDGRRLLHQALLINHPQRDDDAKAAQASLREGIAEFNSLAQILRTQDREAEACALDIERALAIMDLATVHLDKRYDVYSLAWQASKLLAQVEASKDRTHALLAKAHRVRAKQIECDFSQAAQMLAEFDRDDQKLPPDVRRLLDSYAALVDRIDPAVKGSRAEEMIKRSKAWLERYPEHRESPEGRRLQFQQLLGILELVGFTKSDGYNGEDFEGLSGEELQEADDRVRSAAVIAANLVRGRGDFSDRASRWLAVTRDYQAAAAARTP